jgi:photosystem II stability/assembly factor-like uncharacterized protein
MKNLFLVIAICCVKILHAQYNWTNVSSAPYNASKQDGVFFINKDTGWVVNGSGAINKTINGGASWIKQKNSPGTYFRSVAFVNNQIGYAGNVGTNYFPNVTDANPLYKTIDGGNSWIEVTSSITGTIPEGICAIQAVNANVIYAAGRVGGPPVIIKSVDGGASWVGKNLSPQCEMILDIHFQSEDTGYVFAGTSADITEASARILRTTDGGQNWIPVYTSNRQFEITWKASFPSSQVGYATIQSYNSSSTQRYIVKTTDGGLTWNELPLVNNGTREFGIGFINDSVGWVGGENSGYQTLNGGLTWTSANLGQYANKFSIVKNTDGSSTAYAIGLRLYKMTTGIASGLNKDKMGTKNELVHPNPVTSGGYVSISLETIKSKMIKAELISADGKSTYPLFKGYYMGTHESPFMLQLPNITPGNYLIQFTDEAGTVVTQKLILTY